jgi:hypothetical protein
MFDATQPWLPLLDNEPRPDQPARKARRRASPASLAVGSGPEHRVARQAFLGIASSWGLTATEAPRFLGEPLSSDVERLERLHGVLGAHRSLLLIAPEPARYVALLRRPDSAFDGASMLQVMLQNGLPGIARVRAHLLAQIAR